MARKMTKKERMERLRDWVLFGTGDNPHGAKPKFKDVKLSDVLPFPFRSGIYEHMTQKQIELYSQNIDKVNPVCDYHEFDAVWDRAIKDAIEKHRRYNNRWWRRVYLYWGKWRWPRRSNIIEWP